MFNNQEGLIDVSLEGSAYTVTVDFKDQNVTVNGATIIDGQSNNIKDALGISILCLVKDTLGTPLQTIDVSVKTGTWTFIPEVKQFGSITALQHTKFVISIAQVGIDAGLLKMTTENGSPAITENFFIKISNNPLDLYKCVASATRVLTASDESVANSIAVKRGVLNKLKKAISTLDTIDTKEEFNAVMDECEQDLINGNLMDGELIVKFQNCRRLGMVLPNDRRICQKALNEIGAALMKSLGGITWDSIHLGDGIIQQAGGVNPSFATHHVFRTNTTGSVSGFIGGILPDTKTEHGVDSLNNVIQPANLLDKPFNSGGHFNVPTDKVLSPREFVVDGVVYNAGTPFTQQMLRFEEFVSAPIDKTVSDETSPNVPLPSALNNEFPLEEDMQSFVAQASTETPNIGYAPTEISNVDKPNPWAEQIKTTLPSLGGSFTGVAEGRAPGTHGMHKTWLGNKPAEIITTCVSAVYVNGGARDAGQSHNGYKWGEFGPGGLYHKVLDLLAKSGTTEGVAPRFHCGERNADGSLIDANDNGLPTQKPETLWTFDGTFPSKLLMARYGQPVILRNYNLLGISPENNRGFGMHTTTTHEHNGPTGGESDGFANSFFFPAQYYDYLFPMVLSGWKSLNTDAVAPNAAGPNDYKRDGAGVPMLDTKGNKIVLPNKQIPGLWNETMSTHWFHDHMLDYTAQNVYKGNAAMMNYYSGLDRGNEEIDDGVNLRLPSGTARGWGNRDYDVNLVIADKAWDAEGQLWFNPFNTNGFLGDKLLTNWLLEPWFNVRARRYRFRILNGAVSRFMKYAFVAQRNDATGSLQGPAGSGVSYDPVPFWLIGNCGNLLHHAIRMDGTNGTTAGHLPVQAIAERFDIIIDFSAYEPDTKLYMINVLEHKNGRRPNRVVPLKDILDGTYTSGEEVGRDGNTIPVDGSKLLTGDPCVSKFLEFRVNSMDPSVSAVDKSCDPSDYEIGKKTMIPILPIDENTIKTAIHRNFLFTNLPGTQDKWAIETDGQGEAFAMDPRRLSAAPKLNATEIWHIKNGASTWAHNVHIHFTEGKILLRDGKLPPIWEQFARKDVYRVGGLDDSSEEMTIALTFRDTPGMYMMHCHNTQHEDHAMLLRWDIEEDSCVTPLPCPIPTWAGVKFAETLGVPTYKTGSSLPSNDPNEMIKRLKLHNEQIPNSDFGLYFANGLGIPPSTFGFNEKNEN